MLFVLSQGSEIAALWARQQQSICMRRHLLLSRACFLHDVLGCAEPYVAPAVALSCLSCPAGIVGITAACLGAHVMLTDMRDVLPQIYENVQANAELIEAAGGSATVSELDWTEPDDEVGVD
jgi:hypothetical protein